MLNPFILCPLLVILFIHMLLLLVGQGEIIIKFYKHLYNKIMVVIIKSIVFILIIAILSVIVVALYVVHKDMFAHIDFLLYIICVINVILTFILINKIKVFNKRIDELE